MTDKINDSSLILIAAYSIHCAQIFVVTHNVKCRMQHILLHHIALPTDRGDNTIVTSDSVCCVVCGQ